MQRFRFHWSDAFLALALLIPTVCHSHFIWLRPEVTGEQQALQVYFAEDASPDEPDLLTRLNGMVVHQLREGLEPVVVPVTLGEKDLSGAVTEADKSLFIAQHDLGVMTRGDATFRLKYYAKTGPELGHPAWTKVDASKHLALDVVPVLKGKEIVVQVRFNGTPVAAAEVKASAGGMGDFEGSTSATGEATLPIGKAGVYSIRAKHVEEQPGELDGKSYTSVRHYSTVAVEVTPAQQPVASRVLSKMEQPVTSFGSAVLDGKVYTYGGHMGEAHGYDCDSQEKSLRRMDLTTGVWETVATGPGLQGLALVAHGHKLYRLGGFVAKNAHGADNDLWSQTGVAAFDPQTNAWTEMPALPEARSSFDAAVLGDTIYVIGGWSMAGKEKTWHETAWSLNLADAQPQWKSIANPAFPRRALAVAAHGGKIYALGGMQKVGGSTEAVEIYDPQANTWSTGPALIDPKTPDEDGNQPPAGAGFGVSAFATGGRLYLSTSSGTLQRRTADGSSWDIIGATPTPRFFHRLLPAGDHELVVLGGAHMGVGKFEEVEVLTVE